MARLTFIVAAKVDVFADCVKLKSGSTFVDSIYRGLNYTGQTPKTITVVNTCRTAFNLPAQTLFTFTENGSTFTATINQTQIPANQEVQIPVIYNGVYNGTENTLTPNITINGSSIQGTVNVLEQDRPPVTQDNTINLPNRTNKELRKTDLIYSDPNNDPITHVRFTGDVSKLFTDSGMTTNYVANTELPIDFVLYFKAPDQDDAHTYEVNYDVKANGVWSN